MEFDGALQTFLHESRELLQAMEDALLACGPAGGSAEMVNAVFRAAHTIKGSAGLFGLDHIVAFTHVAESVLDEVRVGAVAIDADLVVLLLSCCDHIAALIDTIGGSDATSDGVMAAGALLLARLSGYLAGDAGSAKPGVAAAPAAQQAVGAGGGLWHISLRFGPDVLRNGMDPLSFLRYLGTLGNIAGSATVADRLPPASAMDPESCYLGFEVALRSTAERAAIEEVFAFFGDDCTLRILPPHSRAADYLELMRALPEDCARLSELLVRCGSVSTQELAAALAQREGGAAQRPAGAPPSGQLALPEPVRAQKAQESRSIRVDADKLDQLINLIGELTIAGASANLVARRAQSAELQESSAVLSSLVEQVRDSALQLRMVRIGATFNRFQRVVHDVAKEIGKDIGLAVNGADTELDKTVVERIVDPLTHLVRNAIDHGIEAAELRAARGKPPRGTVTLNAYHDSGCIVIEVGDDGGGLKRERILAKAIERGLVEADAILSDNDIYSLVFEPGFSTAEQVTNLSGRGVGMDVVKRNIVALRGTVDIDSVEGTGTLVRVRLPLTLAIIDGFLVSLGQAMFIIPLDMIEECVEFAAEPGQDYANLRGAVLPFVRLREVFGTGGTPPRRESIVVVNCAGQKAGLLVDALLGEFQTVIKPMNRIFSHIRCISGSSILGSGEVALILDVPALLLQSSALAVSAAA